MQLSKMIPSSIELSEANRNLIAPPQIQRTLNRGRRWKQTGGACCCLVVAMVCVAAGGVLSVRDCESEHNDACLANKHIYAPILLGTSLILDCISGCLFWNAHFGE
ncbi:MAG: hypothetical protein WAM28_07915 [Chlamydiales bacterium]